MTSRLTSDMTPDRPAAAPAPSPEGKAGTPSDRPKADTPHVASPPTSPWWTAPAGKPVDIPAFGRSLFETLLAWLAPAPQQIPLRIRIRR
jgi:hypothetical protein